MQKTKSKKQKTKKVKAGTKGRWMREGSYVEAELDLKNVAVE